MPSFVHSRADLIVAGILSIDEMRDCLSPVGLVGEFSPVDFSRLPLNHSLFALWKSFFAIYLDFAFSWSICLCFLFLLEVLRFVRLHPAQVQVSTSDKACGKILLADISNVRTL